LQDARSWITPDGEESVVVRQDLQPDLIDAGLTCQSRLEYSLDWISREIRRSAWRVVTADTVETELAFLSETHPDLALAVTRKLAPDRLARVLRDLLRERVSIRDFILILESVVTFDRVAADEWDFVILDDRLPVHPRLAAIRSPAMHEAELVRHIRLGLRRTISQTYSRGAKAITALWLDTALVKDKLLEHLAALYGAPGATPLDAGALDRIRANISPPIAAKSLSGSQPPILLATGSTRSLIYDLMADEFPDLAVLAPDELDTRVEVQQLGTISLNLT